MQDAEGESMMGKTGTDLLLSGIVLHCIKVEAGEWSRGREINIIVMEG